MNAVLTALLLLAAPLRAGSEPAVIGIRVDPAPGATELSIALGGGAHARVREPLIIGQRARIEIEIPRATLNVNRRGFDDPHGAILALRAAHDVLGTHIAVELPADRKYEVRRGSNGVLLVVTTADETAAEWHTGVPGRGEPPRVLAQAATPISIPAPQARSPISSPAVSPISRPSAAGAASVPEPEAVPANALSAAGAAPAPGRSSVTSPSPRPGPKSGPSPRPSSVPGIPTPAQLLTLLALVALPSALLALLRRRAHAAGHAPAPSAPTAPKAAKPTKAPKAPRAAKAKKAAEPARDAAKLARKAAKAAAKTSAPDLWAARTLAGTDAPALEVARRTGLSQDAVLLLRRRMAGATNAADSAAAGRNVRPAPRGTAAPANAAR